MTQAPLYSTFSINETLVMVAHNGTTKQKECMKWDFTKNKIKDKACINNAQAVQVGNELGCDIKLYVCVSLV